MNTHSDMTSDTPFTLGMLGGMSFEATTLYYQKINQRIRENAGGLHSANLLIRSVDFHDIVTFQKADQWDLAGAKLAHDANRLEQAGANAMMICAVTMHLVAPQVKAAINIPLIDIIEETANVITNHQKRKPLLIATRYTMEHGFYHKAMAQYGIDIQTPNAQQREEIHRIIFDELSCGKILEDSQAFLKKVINDAQQSGCDSVIFGCTEICLILGDQPLRLPHYDSTEIHINAAVRTLLGHQTSHRS